MPIVPRVLFWGVLPTTESDITTGPASGKRWIITRMTACNLTTTHWVRATLRHFIDANNIVTLADEIVFPAKNTPGAYVWEYGPFVMAHGHRIRGVSPTASAIQVVAYGYEEDV